eukprot:jgi/Hompol1/4749/HPOL_003844-RA
MLVSFAFVSAALVGALAAPAPPEYYLHPVVGATKNTNVKSIHRVITNSHPNLSSPPHSQGQAFARKASAAPMSLFAAAPADDPSNHEIPDLSQTGTHRWATYEVSCAGGYKVRFSIAALNTASASNQTLIAEHIGIRANENCGEIHQVLDKRVFVHGSSLWGLYSPEPTKDPSWYKIQSLIKLNIVPNGAYNTKYLKFNLFFRIDPQQQNIISYNEGYVFVGDDCSDNGNSKRLWNNYGAGGGTNLHVFDMWSTSQAETEDPGPNAPTGWRIKVWPTFVLCNNDADSFTVAKWKEEYHFYKRDTEPTLRYESCILSYNNILAGAQNIDRHSCMVTGNDGILSKTLAKEHILSRAYLNFTHTDTLLDFCKAYDGHVFVDAKGTEHRAVVEFAPFQRVAKKPRPPDARMNTLENGIAPMND